MVTLHVILAAAAIIGALTVVIVGAWSAIAGRRSAGRRDHRSALDRAVLLVVGSVAVAELIGVALLLTGARPADPLHFLYGAAALIVLPVAISFGARTSSVDASRIRRDAWTVVGGIVLLGILFRLYATG